MTARRALMAFLWFVSAFHVAVGLGLNLSPEVAQLMARYYGATVDWTPQFVYILKPLGAFMLVLGVLAARAALDPERNEAVTYGFALLFAVRALQRLVLGQEVQHAFAIPASRNLLNVVLFFAMSALLLLLVRRSSSRPQ